MLLNKQGLRIKLPEDQVHDIYIKPQENMHFSYHMCCGYYYGHVCASICIFICDVLPENVRINHSANT